MAKFIVRNSNKKKNGGSIVKLIEKLQKKILLGRNKSTSTYVPEDVKEGHFAVIAEDRKEDQEPKRFVLPLSCLTNPTFVRLLEQAEEEYGFDHEGALTIPCKPSELHKMLQQWQQEEYNSSNNYTFFQNY
ncbi:auxin-responsive protein SAUR50-like [Trifolium pratense]|uniref:auxin-responsive protein SAUR50-like n=1 Tax=Trifolium pratense TaxID=57577 RepID=UPI001E693F9D|nr:auxin-responsive protein SAUR50-like [Trifolium pratense]